MGDVFDYLAWRGDLSFGQDSFNAVDNLVLATLSYLDWREAVPERFAQTVTLAEAAKRCQKLHEQDKTAAPQSFLGKNNRLLAEAAASERFGQILVTGFAEYQDKEKAQQFAAVTFILGDGTAYLAFRGTDETIAGWKEDFNMAFMPEVPSQAEAARYLRQAAAALSGDLRLGGHSKGGNLAVYAASFAPPLVQSRIAGIYNNDGPGFGRQVLDSAGYQNIAALVAMYVPQSSIVGMLLEHDGAYTVVRSNRVGLMQHDAYSWIVERNHFICLSTVNNGSRFFDRTVKEWLLDIDTPERTRFLDTLYEIFDATGANTWPELTAQWHRNAGIILKSLKQVDEPTREMVQQVLARLWQAAKRNLYMVKPGKQILPDAFPLKNSVGNKALRLRKK